MSKRVKVFVYGTLRRGGRLHGAIEEDRSAQFMGMDTVKGRIYNNMNSYPTLDIEGEGIVVGEIFDLDESTLRILDHIEGYDPSNLKHCLFFRKTVTTHGGHEVFVYTMGSGLRNRFKDQPHIESGDWIKFFSEIQAKYRADWEALQAREASKTRGKKKK